MIKKISLIIIASFFLSQKTNSKDFDMDRSLIEKGIINEYFEVKNLTKLESLLWSMNDNAIKRFPYKNKDIIFYNSWIGPNGLSIKSSFIGFNSKEDLLSLGSKDESLQKLIYNISCEIVYTEPRLFLSNFFKITLKGNIEIIFLDENMNIYMKSNNNIKEC